ncbi:Tetratricopeptide repeat protein [compost metagenome]
MKLLIIFLFPFLSAAQFSEPARSFDTVKIQYYADKLNEVRLFSQARQKYLDSILLEKPDIAYIWQQKAMPLFKQKKYELGLQYLDSAIKYDKTDHYFEYGAFIKCIFVKSYKSAITDFERLKTKQPIGFVMDHSYDFYTGLSYLQLNQFDKAEEYLQKSIRYSEEKWGDGHFVEYFYLGIVKMEQDDPEKALQWFDKTLSIYPEFPDVKYYKALLFQQKNKNKEAKILINQAMNDFSKGYTMNESNSQYEEYPYQIKETWLEIELGLIKD